jgi:hypothetical protein
MYNCTAMHRTQKQSFLYTPFLPLSQDLAIQYPSQKQSSYDTLLPQHKDTAINNLRNSLPVTLYYTLA